MITYKIYICVIGILIRVKANENVPIVITTWNFTEAANQAWQVLKQGGCALDAVETGAITCEELQCDGTVGYGGSPDEDGETTLDAMIMDGKNINVGAVGALRNVKKAVSVARHVLEKTRHSMLVGELATQFAVQMGFQKESLSSPVSKKLWKEWHNNHNCQPNFWMKVTPDPTKHCGPYTSSEMKYSKHYQSAYQIDQFNHDTIGIIALDYKGDIAAGTSSNGAKYKVPGRVGDSPIIGAGAYADNSIGGAVATGDGDVMMRFLPSFLAVEEMRRGATPTEAANEAIHRIARYYPDFMGAIIAVTKDGVHGAACHGIEYFPYVVCNKNTCDDEPKSIFIKC